VAVVVVGGGGGGKGRVFFFSSLRLSKVYCQLPKAVAAGDGYKHQTLNCIKYCCLSFARFNHHHIMYHHW
jgi:hypothetical protein